MPVVVQRSNLRRPVPELPRREIPDPSRRLELRVELPAVDLPGLRWRYPYWVLELFVALRILVSISG